MIGRVAPPFTTRRMLLQLGVQAVRRPRALPARINRTNLAAWNRFRRTTARCPLCGHEGSLLHELPDLETFAHHHIDPLRETLRCRGCKAKMRDRMLAAGLLDALGERGVTASTIDELSTVLPADVTILDTDAHSRISHRLKDHPGFHRSLYVPDRANGDSLGEERLLNVDLERMPFSDDSFDIIITSEVMEHVRYVDRAHTEIARCLRPGGTYLFTVPYDERLERTWRLVDEETDRDLVHPPHIHGDPMLREEGIRSYRVFGRDITDQLAKAGLSAEFHRVERPELGIFGGDLFVARVVSTGSTTGDGTTPTLDEVMAR
jgi:hypothetical protein